MARTITEQYYAKDGAWIPVAPPAVSMNSLTDVNVSVPPQVGESLVWDGAAWKPESLVPPLPEPPDPVWGAGFPYLYGPATTTGQVEIDASGTVLTFNATDTAGGTPIAPGTTPWVTNVRLTSTATEVVFTGNAPFADNAGVWTVPGTVTSGDPTAFTVGEAITLTYTLESQTTDEDLYLVLVDGQSPPQWIPQTSQVPGVDSLDDLTDVDTVTNPPSQGNALTFVAGTWIPQMGLPPIPTVDPTWVDAGRWLMGDHLITSEFSGDDPTNPTVIHVNDVPYDGDAAPILALQAGAELQIEQGAYGGSYFTLTADPVQQVGYFDIPVTKTSGNWGDHPGETCTFRYFALPADPPPSILVLPGRIPIPVWKPIGATELGIELAALRAELNEVKRRLADLG